MTQNNRRLSPLTTLDEPFKMIHPDGEFMCYVSKKRAQWYCNKKLAEWINNSTFKLKFNPNGIGKRGLKFYETKQENSCVVCGNSNKDNLTKHHVVPYVFRRNFPVIYKQSNHHDVLIVCEKCHIKYETHASEFKNKLAKDFNLLTHANPLPNEAFN